MFDEAELYTFIAKFKLGVLGTVSDNNTPQSALVGFAVTPGLELIFDTVKDSRKYPNLISRPSCSFVIGWAGEQTVQYEGKARELRPPDLERYQKIYFEVWPECREHLTWPGIVYFLVRPTWIRYSDFDQSPPIIREFAFRSSRWPFSCPGGSICIADWPCRAVHCWPEFGAFMNAWSSRKYVIVRPRGFTGIRSFGTCRRNKYRKLAVQSVFFSTEWSAGLYSTR